MSLQAGLWFSEVATQLIYFKGGIHPVPPAYRPAYIVWYDDIKL